MSDDGDGREGRREGEEKRGMEKVGMGRGRGMAIKKGKTSI